MGKPNIFFRLTKVDVAQRTVEGIATAEVADKAGEICDYESTKPYYEKWSDGIKKASGGKSLGNVRAMHGNVAAGKITDIIYDDVKKAISIVAKIVDDAEWKKVVEGVYTGFSQGGEYIKRWADGEFTRYTAEPSEVSIVDNPCLGVATFSVVKADGIVEEKKFKEPAPEVEQVWLCKDGVTTCKTKAAAIKKNAEIDAEAAIAETRKAIESANASLDKKAKDDEEEVEEEEEEDTKKAAAPKEEEEEVDPKDKEEAEKAAKAKEDKAKEDKEKMCHNKAAIAALVKNEVWDAKMALDALVIISDLIFFESAEAENEESQLVDLKVAVDKLKAFIASEIMEKEPEPLAASAAIGELAKAADEKLAKAEAMNESLTKALGDVNGLVATLTKRIETLEKSPAPRKGAVFAVERETEFSNEAPGKPVDAVNYNSLRLSPEDMRKIRII